MTQPRQRATDCVYIGIGNSDDKLSQARWSEFAAATYTQILEITQGPGRRPKLVGAWYSAPAAPWQNACWCLTVEITHGSLLDHLQVQLRRIARTYGQDSVSWAPAFTQHLTPMQEAPE